jgi:hypothetical protein
MSDIILPDGRPAPDPNSGAQRPSNEQVLSFIDKQVQQQEADAMAGNIVNMHDQILDERRKKQLMVASHIVMVQLDADSKLMEAIAKDPKTPLQEAHDKMQMARCFRITMGWLQGLVGTQMAVDKAKDQKPENQ